ncbi:MAG: asparaginase [Lachnospiraceae bacterium]|jgi:L-asparaginase|nr:asparaginase [Lachnospiraceae bacterium]
MQMGKPRVAVFATGGTILDSKDIDTGRVTPGLTADAVLQGMPALGRFDLDVFTPFNIPGSDLSPQEGLTLAQGIRRAIETPGTLGVVVLQGTDTIDEFPYLIELMVDCAKPVVFTGAMKSTQDTYQDAQGNVFGAALIATHPASRGKGVLVYFNETIFAAREILKYHAARIDAFRSDRAPLGYVVDESVRYIRESAQGATYPVDRLSVQVPILKVYTGMDPFLLDAALDAGADGIVLEAYGTGNVPGAMAPSIRRALGKGIPVLVASRCFTGEAYPCYNHVGGGAMLAEEGAVLTGELDAIKSRLKLMVLLEAGMGMRDIRAAFAG